jgi:hypothetical protein
MTLDTNKTKMRTLLFCSLLLSLFFSNPANSGNISGTWKFEKAKEYFATEKEVSPPKHSTIQIVNGSLGLPPRCYEKLKKENYYYSDPFQFLLKADVDEKTFARYLEKNFTFDLPKTKFYYPISCDKSIIGDKFDSIFFSEKKLIVSYAGSLFYSFSRSEGGTSTISSDAELYGHKLSHLPFNIEIYGTLCMPIIPRIKGVPQSTQKCAPVHYPYVATKNSKNPLAQLIGMHNYEKGGAEVAFEYAPPFASNLHPTYVVLPPLKDVLLVRVDDLEPGNNENRDTMYGAYLAVKNGKITDQLNVNCSITTNHLCVDENGKKQYQLLETGKFKKLQ